MSEAQVTHSIQMKMAVLYAVTALFAVASSMEILELPTRHIVEISTGKVFYVQGPYGVATISSFLQASTLCSMYGAELAYGHELYQAGLAGLSICRCGFLAESYVAYPMFFPNPRCAEGMTGLQPCPITYEKWQKEGYDAFCMLLNPGRKRQQAPDGAVDIGPGWVFHHQSNGGDRTIASGSKAKFECDMLGATLATWEQLDQARILGLHSCKCGWLADRRVAYSQTGDNPSCEPSNCVEPQPANRVGVVECVGQDREHYGFNAYCYRPKDFITPRPKQPGQPVPGGYIFPVEGPDGENTIRCRREAEEVCALHGATLASAAEYYLAFDSGEIQDCNCAYLSNSISYSVAEKGQCQSGVNDDKLGVFSCAENWTQMGQKGYKAYCFKGKLEERQGTDDTGVPIPGGYVFLHANYDSNHTLVSSREADHYCRGRGAVVASMTQLTQAKDRGMTHCLCGWLADERAAYPLHDKLPYCGNHVGLVQCPLKGLSPNWGTYCYQPVRLVCRNNDFKELLSAIFTVMKLK